jgi:hypothetical protein
MNARLVARPPAGLLATLVIALLVVACGGTASSNAPSASAAATTAPSASGDTSGSPGASPSGEAEGPSPTPWPGGIVEAVGLLGRADLEVQKAGGDLGAAAANEDLKAMWGAADGFVPLLEKMQGQVDRIRDYPETATAAAAYDTALADMLAGAKGIRDAIDAKDATALQGAVQQLGTGTAEYGEARKLIAPLVDRAILMEKVLVK